MRRNYLEIMTDERDITLVGYFKLVMDVFIDGGMKVWISTLVMHVVRTLVVIAAMIYFGDYSFMSALPYAILGIVCIIPFELSFAWKMSMFIRKHCMRKLSHL